MYNFYRNVVIIGLGIFLFSCSPVYYSEPQTYGGTLQTKVSSDIWGEWSNSDKRIEFENKYNDFMENDGFFNEFMMSSDNISLIFILLSIVSLSEQLSMNPILLCNSVQLNNGANVYIL